jgi:hypothetical protein
MCIIHHLEEAVHHLLFANGYRHTVIARVFAQNSKC